MGNTFSTAFVIASSIATVVTAICTIIYVRLTNKYVKLTNQQVVLTNKILQTNQMANIDETRPFIVLSMPSRDDMVNLVIYNIGKRPAYDVEITIDPPLKNIDTRYKKVNSDSLLNLSFVPPQFELSNLICLPEEVIKNKEDLEPFKITISYSDYRKITYKEEYQISLDAYITNGKMRQYTDQHYLNKISNNLEKLEDLKEIGRKLDIICDKLDNNKVKCLEDGTPIQEIKKVK